MCYDVKFQDTLEYFKYIAPGVYNKKASEIDSL
jgi:hypothetical protein